MYFVVKVLDDRDWFAAIGVDINTKELMAEVIEFLERRKRKKRSKRSNGWDSMVLSYARFTCI